MVLLNRRKYMGVRRSPQGAPLNLADAVITVAESVQYTGSPRTPSVTVVYEGATLVVNTDYFVAYNDNTNVGAATVVVTGTGSFTGTVVKTFQITSSTPPSSGSWDQADVEDAALVQTTGNISSGTRPFCVRGGHLFSGNNEGAVFSWVYDDSTKSFSSDETHTYSNGYAGGFCFSRDGMYSYMYIYYSGYQTVYMYAHSTAWDVSEVRTHYWDHGVCTPYAQPKKATWSDFATGVDINPDGTRLYVAMTSGLLHTNYLATPFDVTSASSSSLSTVDLEALANITHVFGMQIAPDGKRITLIGSGGVVYMFNIGTAWDLSTIDASSKRTFDAGLSGLTVYGVGLSDDGTKMFVKTSGSQTVRVYDLAA